jgi:hypothetical protein
MKLRDQIKDCPENIKALIKENDILDIEITDKKQGIAEVNKLSDMEQKFILGTLISKYFKT